MQQAIRDEREESKHMRIEGKAKMTMTMTTTNRFSFAHIYQLNYLSFDMHLLPSFGEDTYLSTRCFSLSFSFTISASTKLFDALSERHECNGSDMKNS